MTLHINILFPTLLLFFLSADSQKISKSDNLTRQPSTPYPNPFPPIRQEVGPWVPRERKQSATMPFPELSNAGARSKGDNNGWLQTFTVDEGRQIGGVRSYRRRTSPGGRQEWFPLSFSPAGEVNGSPAIALPESGVPWFQDLKEWLGDRGRRPAFRPHWHDPVQSRCLRKKGATALILYNSRPIIRIS